MKPLIILTFAIGLLSSATRAELAEIEGITFARYGTRELKLDLYKPADRSEPLPAIVCLHGGGWRSGHRGHYRKFARYIAEQGYVVVSIDYRLSGEAPFPAQIQDCKAAVRWLRANADAHGVDPNRIGATGHSAGGHLAALLATSGGVEALEGNGGHADYSSAIQAAAPMSAQSDLESDRIRSMTAQPGAEIWHNFLGGSLGDNEASYQLASPRRHLDPQDPPMLFVTGELDNLDTRAIPIRSDMQRMNIPSGLLVIPGAPHPLMGDERWYGIALEVAVHFFDHHL